MRRSRRTRSGQVSSCVSRHEAFKAEMAIELEAQDVPTRHSSAYSVLGRSGREVQQRARRVVAQSRVLAEICSRAIRLMSEGKKRRVARIWSVIPSLDSIAGGDRVLARRLHSQVRMRLDEKCIRDHSELDRAAIPEPHRSA